MIGLEIPKFLEILNYFSFFCGLCLLGISGSRSKNFENLLTIIYIDIVYSSRFTWYYIYSA